MSLLVAAVAVTFGAQSAFCPLAPVDYFPDAALYTPSLIASGVPFALLGTAVEGGGWGGSVRFPLRPFARAQAAYLQTREGDRAVGSVGARFSSLGLGAALLVADTGGATRLTPLLSTHLPLPLPGLGTLTAAATFGLPYGVPPTTTLSGALVTAFSMPQVVALSLTRPTGSGTWGMGVGVDCSFATRYTDVSFRVGYRDDPYLGSRTGYAERRKALVLGTGLNVGLLSADLARAVPLSAGAADRDALEFTLTVTP